MILFLYFILLKNNIFFFAHSSEPFIFVRHASTDWEVGSIIQGPQDLPLNEKGIKEAESAANFLSTFLESGDEYVIISSNLQRSVNTAEIISKKINIPVNLNSGLQEKYFGDFRLKKIFCKKTNKEIPLDAEQEDVFHERIKTTFSKLLSSTSSLNKKKIIVSHGEVLKYLSKILTKVEHNIPRGGIVLFTPGEENNPWTYKTLKE